MINLLPHKGHTALKHEYILRVISVYGFLLSGVFIAASILLVPSYVLTLSQLSGAQSVGKQVGETQDAFSAAHDEIKVINTVMAQLKKSNTTDTISEIFEEIVTVAPQGIRFTTFQAGHIDGDGKLSEARIQGIADTRVILSSFKKKLEDSPRFSEALVPISDLARDTDLTFTITLTLEGSSQSKQSP